MAKFQVGEIVAVVGVPAGCLGSDQAATKILEIGDGKLYGLEGLKNDYWVYHPLGRCMADERFLRKLPPDSHAEDTTEDPGLTRLKKLLQQDSVKHKRPALPIRYIRHRRRAGSPYRRKRVEAI